MKKIFGAITGTNFIVACNCSGDSDKDNLINTDRFNAGEKDLSYRNITVCGGILHYCPAKIHFTL